MRNVPGAIYRGEMSDSWDIKLIGDEIERITGYPASDFTSGGRTVGSLIHPDDFEAQRAEVNAAVAAGRQFELHYRIVRADGEVRWVLERGQRATDVDGVWLDGVMFDITDRVRTEEALRRSETEAARAAEVAASRARIVAASDAARRRLERDLHDGAQQQLVNAMLTLRLARSAIGRVGPVGEELLDQTQAQMSASLGELRELAQGIHPVLLTDRGLVAAVESLATRSSLPVDVAGELSARPRPEVESALYFTVAEALTNIAKYAQAHHVDVSIGEPDGEVEIAVVDDGCGGADPASGSGLRGLADRLEALGGTLDVRSAPGEGTAITARVPR
jgi:PAS domain S-box-containing protein